MNTKRRAVLAVSITLATLAALVVSVAVQPASAADTPDPRIAAAQANVAAYCVALVDDATTTRQRSTRADLCAMWTRELADLQTPTTPPPTTQPPTPSPTATPTPSPTSTQPPTSGWPTAATTGTPAGWVPTSTRSTSLTITTAGAIVQDIRFTGGAGLVIAADNVTVKRLEFQGGQITLWRGSGCWAGLTVSDTSFLPEAGDARGGASDGAIVPGAYTATRVKILNRIEGLRSGACGPVSVIDTYMEINDGGQCALHADGIQGYNGLGIIVRNTWIDNRKETCGTAPFFYPRNQGNQPPVDIDGLWLAGGTYSLRLGVGPATVRNVHILDGSWRYDSAVDVYCPIVTVWDVKIVNTFDQAVRAQACTGDGT